MPAYGIVVDGEIIVYNGFQNEEESLMELPEGGARGWGYYGNPPVLIEPPSIFHYWQSTHFVVNQSEFTPYLKSEIRMYRDQKMATLVEYTGDSTITTVSNLDSINALSRICNGLTMMESDTGTIQWKNANGEYGTTPATYKDIQGLFKECYKREQWSRVAEKAILDKHELTPYEFIQDAKDDFDTELEGE